MLAKPGPVLDSMVAETLGLKVLGYGAVYRDPETADWTIPYDGNGDYFRPLYLKHCVCDAREPEDANYLGHISHCLGVVPEYSTDDAQVAYLLSWLAGKGVVTLSNGDGDSFDCFFLPQQVVFDRELHLVDARAMSGVDAESWAHVVSLTVAAAGGYDPFGEGE